MRLLVVTFTNVECPEPKIIRCDRESLPDILAWYGSYYAGDEYTVQANGQTVKCDGNGEIAPLIIEALPTTTDQGEE